RIPADQFVCADPRGFSQLIASFVASGSLGIPHTPLSSLSPDLLYCSPRPKKKGPGRGPSPGPPGTSYRLLCFFFQRAPRPGSCARPVPIGQGPFVPACAGGRGEYRGRTDGLLRARQAL